MCILLCCKINLSYNTPIKQLKFQRIISLNELKNHQNEKSLKRLVIFYSMSFLHSSVASLLDKFWQHLQQKNHTRTLLNNIKNTSELRKQFSLYPTHISISKVKSHWRKFIISLLLELYYKSYSSFPVLNTTVSCCLLTWVGVSCSLERFFNI